MIDERFVIVGVLLNVFGSIGYLIGTIKGTTKPNKVTWFLWSVAPLVAFFAQISKGVGIQALMTFSVGFVPLLIFIASFVNKKSHWHITKFDILCGILSVCGLMFWGVTREGNIAIFFSVLADFFAAIPTIVKSYKAPETENAQAYLMSGLNGLITSLTITKWTFAYYAFPLYMILGNGIIYALIQFKIGKYFKKI